MKKHQVQNSANISTGELHKYSVNLDNNESVNGTLEIPALGFTSASINLMTATATGTSGNVLGKQAVRKGEVGATFSPAVSLASGAAVSVSAFDIPLSGGYFIVDLTGLTLGVTGRIEIVVVLKR